MSDAKRKRTAASSKETALGAGLHAAFVEMGSGKRFRVRTTQGTRVSATLGDTVERELVEECIRVGRPVLVADSERGPIILGAIQTARSPVTSEEGTLRLKGKTVAIRADQAIELEVGSTSLALQKNGLVEVRGDRMVLNIGALVRFLSARVELP